MSLRLFTTPVLAATLLMSSFGCSKKEAVTPAPNTGSFQLDGTAISCQVKATRGAGSIGTTPYDFLDLDLTPIRSAGGVERLTLHLYKVPGSAADTYALHNLLVYTSGNGSPYNFASNSFTLTARGEGSFSGSFSGRVQAASSSIPGPYTTIANGVFTKVQF